MPRRSLHPAGVVAVVLTLVVALSAGSASGAAPKLRQPSAGAALAQLVRQTAKLPSSAATKRQRARLRKAAGNARRSARKRPCRSVRKLATYRRVLRRIKVKKGRRNARAAAKLGALGSASLAASRALLASPRTRRCGGGVEPNKLDDVKTKVLKSDAKGMKVRVDLPALRFVDTEGGGRVWTELMLPNTDTPSAPGSPGIPVVAQQLAVPDGAKLKVHVADTSSYTIGGVDVAPAQPDPVDAGPPEPDVHTGPYATGPFILDPDGYKQHGLQPAAPADGKILGDSRDVTLGNLQIAAAQYDAPKQSLKVVNSVIVDIKFQGGSHSFSNQLSSPWEQPQRRLVGSLLNAGVIRGVPGVPRCGEEMLVVTNPSTLDAANTFADAKRAQGMRAEVVQTGDAPGQIGSTATEIQTYIRGELTKTDCIHPSYVTILGDTSFVPTFPGINGIESDLPYSLRNDDDELPDVAVGRMVGQNVTEVTTAINKIISYENSPPDGQWLRKATVAGEFQDDENPDQNEDRTFIWFDETARNGILSTPGFGLSVDRIYATYPAGVTPLGFHDGTALPAELQKPAFAWDGTGADVAAAWNEGRYLMIHRDHGWTHGWADPVFTSEDADALTNGAQLPVVLSINCSSGAFQDDTHSFASAALTNPNGGAAGVFGDTEVSPTNHNSQLGLGFLDALLPRVLSGEGPDSKLRVGDALIYGKQRLAGISAPSGPGITGGDGNTRNELYLWHYFGDPSMQMWGGDPIAYPTINDFRAVFDAGATGPGPDPAPYGVRVTLPTAYNGQPFALLRNGQVVGKAVAAGGTAVVPASLDNSQPKPGELFVAFEGDGAVPIQIPVEGVPEPQQPPPPPPGPKANTQLTISCPQFVPTNNGTAHITGTLSPAFAGAAIQLTYQPRTDAAQPGPPVNRVTTTNAQGNWTDDFDTGANDPGGKGDGGYWTVTARYAGDSGHNAATAVSCQFLEPNN
ncbi:MAG: hypothetical protein QOG63_1784 [Thermoleophilaceae bacterium]|nr:hypothetical protein [Thermoleophilaceae bacterium]